MSKFNRGKVIPGIMAAMFTVEYKNHVYFDKAILPTLQVRTWPINKIRAAVKARKLFYAEKSPSFEDSYDGRSWRWCSRDFRELCTCADLKEVGMSLQKEAAAFLADAAGKRMVRQVVPTAERFMMELIRRVEHLELDLLHLAKEVLDSHYDEQASCQCSACRLAGTIAQDDWDNPGSEVSLTTEPGLTHGNRISAKLVLKEQNDIYVGGRNRALAREKKLKDQVEDMQGYAPNDAQLRACSRVANDASDNKFGLVSSGSMSAASV